MFKKGDKVIATARATWCRDYGTIEYATDKVVMVDFGNHWANFHPSDLTYADPPRPTPNDEWDVGECVPLAEGERYWDCCGNAGVLGWNPQGHDDYGHGWRRWRAVPRTPQWPEGSIPVRELKRGQAGKIVHWIGDAYVGCIVQCSLFDGKEKLVEVGGNHWWSPAPSHEYCRVIPLKFDHQSMQFTPDLSTGDKQLDTPSDSR